MTRTRPKIVRIEKKSWVRSVVLNLGSRPPRGASINFQGDASLYAPYNMEDLIITITNKYRLI